ncbi:MAG TPA: LptF/LptG family permease [Pyrinomonadaceae bacterium]|jgi:lipopolysaccharide export LptBFGC system permease protein LptF|nr:LptF/LptG family permease [Pyrinomonadaceae bacterium]
MKILGGRLVERYIIAAILPYLGLSLLLLTFVILAQQAGKFVEILGSADPSLEAVADITLGLIPNILVFTLPMSVLIGTATGLSKLGSDSELIAMRAAGVGTWRFVSPVLLVGFVFTALTLYIGFEIAPRASTLLRDAALKVALSKIESPIQPHTFNTEMPGKVVYVRDGDKTRGQWARVFIHWQDEGQGTRLITARNGRLDVTGEQTELVLTDAVVTTLPSGKERQSTNSPQIVTESSAQFRLRLNTGRNALLKRFQERRVEIDELDWRELLEQARVAESSEKVVLLTAINKRLALCFAPLAFALLGAGFGGRLKRLGRGQAVLISIGAMILYYLVLLGGEQSSRSGMLPPQIGSWLATGLATGVGIISLLINERNVSGGIHARLLASSTISAHVRVGRARNSILLGLLDRSLLRAVFFNFMLAYISLLLIFLIFTLFELLRFISGSEWRLVLLYLLYLVPLASMSLIPIGLLVAVLVTYAILARRNEVVVWWASGQSLYRLSLPTILFSLLISIGLGLLQENVLPQANRRQEAYRAQIRGGLNRAMTPTGVQWLAVPDTRRLYSYKYGNDAQTLLTPVIYEFDSEGIHLRRLISGEAAKWQGINLLEFEDAEVMEIGRANKASIDQAGKYVLAETTPAQSFKPLLNKPSELNSKILSEYIRTLKNVRPDEITGLRIALYRRSADIAMPIILALIGIPFGVLFGRRSAFWAIGAAIFIGLALWGSASAFQQLGNYKLLPAALAAWAAPLIFTTLGLILFSRART